MTTTQTILGANTTYESHCPKCGCAHIVELITDAEGKEYWTIIQGCEHLGQATTELDQ